MKKIMHAGAAVLTMAALTSQSSAQTAPQNEKNLPSHATTPKPELKVLLKAAPRAGTETIVVEVVAFGDREPQLHVLHGQAGTPPPTPMADLLVTLVFKDGHMVRPALLNPGLKELAGFSGHGGVTESAVYVLTGLPVGELRAVRVKFRGELSPKTPFQAL